MRGATNNQSPHQIPKLRAVELTKHVMSQLLYPPNTMFNCRSVFSPLKRTKPRFYPLNDSSIERNNHTPWSIVPMFLSHSILFNKNSLLPFISDLLGVPTPVWGHLLDARWFRPLKVKTKDPNEGGIQTKLPKSKQLNQKWILGWSQVKPLDPDRSAERAAKIQK